MKVITVINTCYYYYLGKKILKKFQIIKIK